LHRMGKPEGWITWGVRTDGFVFRQTNLTGEACIIQTAGKPKQAETQGWEYAVQGGR